jgi:hypothetical protein
LLNYIPVKLTSLNLLLYFNKLLPEKTLGHKHGQKKTGA